MDVVHQRCAGIDVHKRFVTVAVRIGGAKPSVREFATDTANLLGLVDWLQEQKVDDVAMEATGAYWKPIYNLLEAAGLHPIIGNVTQMKGLPGRKTDVGDAEWICDLHRHGLVKPSFIPPRAQRELREVVRYRVMLVEERAAEANRIARVGANIKLASVATDILGESGRAMLAAMVNGTTDPEQLADLALGKDEPLPVETLA